MAEPKPFASLSSGLLARKGAARPAMRRQGMSTFPANEPQHHAHEDLGWNDMGYDVDPPRGGDAEVEGFDENGESGVQHGSLLAGAIPEVVRQQGELAEKLGEVEADDAEEWEDDPLAYSDESYSDEDGNVPLQEAEHGESDDSTQDDSTQSAAFEGSSEEEEFPESPLMRKVLSEKPKAKAAANQENDDTSIVDEAVPSQRVKAAPADESVAGDTRSHTVDEVSQSAAAKKRAAFTLRVDPDRHLKLRLACALSNRSAQQLVTEALDEFLAKLPEVHELAGRVPR